MHLSIQLIGAPQFQLDHIPVTAGRRAVVALLAYLAVRDGEHPNQRYSREALAALLWTEYEGAKALSNLRHTLWEVTQFIGEGWVITEHETIFLNPGADITLDVAQFRSLLRRAGAQPDPAQRIRLLADAASLYRDDFMSGFSLKGGSNFNEWVFAQGEALRQDLTEILQMLAEDYVTLEQASSAIPYAQRLITLDPMNEPANRTLMELYARTDQTPAAIKQYQALEKLLRKELNVDPQPETREMYKRIRKGDLKPVSDQRKTPRPGMTQPNHNLPAPLTTFIGRERERHEISRLLTHHRLVTLIGAGGIGKTRLALETGHALLHQFRDGVWLIPLESLTDEDLVPQTVASFLNIAETSERSLIETLVHALRSRALLLLLDNCEHLLDACARLAETLLRTCPTLKILATSRDVLHLEGEAVYHVPPLIVPESQRGQSADEAVRSEAVQLFAERGMLVASGFEITEANFATIARICNRLEGIPLAIELAAAHVDIFTPEEILHQLNRSFDLLASHTRSAMPRHQTMHASIDWGWNLLREEERVFMRGMSVFRGGWTLHAAQVMHAGNPRELIGVLVKKSFVVVHQQTEHGTRYGFHEVVRAFAQEKLVEAGEEEMIRDRHLEYYLELVRQIETAAQGADQDSWLERLFVERDNIRAAMEWAARTNVQAGLYISNRLRTFWEDYDLREEVRWLLMI